MRILTTVSLLVYVKVLFLVLYIYIYICIYIQNFYTKTLIIYQAFISFVFNIVKKNKTFVNNLQTFNLNYKK